MHIKSLLNTEYNLVLSHSNMAFNIKFLKNASDPGQTEGKKCLMARPRSACGYTVSLIQSAVRLQNYGIM